MVARLRFEARYMNPSGGAVLSKVGHFKFWLMNR